MECFYLNWMQVNVYLSFCYFTFFIQHSTAFFFKIKTFSSFSFLLFRLLFRLCPDPEKEIKEKKPIIIVTHLPTSTITSI